MIVNAVFDLAPTCSRNLRHVILWGHEISYETEKKKLRVSILLIRGIVNYNKNAN